MIVPPAPQPPWWALPLEHIIEAFIVACVPVAATVVRGLISHREHVQTKGQVAGVDAKLDVLHEQMNGNLDQRIDERIRMARGE